MITLTEIADAADGLTAGVPVGDYLRGEGWDFDDLMFFCRVWAGDDVARIAAADAVPRLAAFRDACQAAVLAGVVIGYRLGRGNA